MAIREASCELLALECLLSNFAVLMDKHSPVAIDTLDANGADFAS